MVLRNRLDYGFDGYQTPVIPRGPRSLRRGLRKKPVDNSQICAFELLAAVADKLLQESESSACSNAAEGKDQIDFHEDCIKMEEVEEDQALKSGYHNRESFMESVFISELSAKEFNMKSSLHRSQHAHSDTLPVLDNMSNSYFPIGCDVKLENCKKNDAFEKYLVKPEGGSSDYGESCNGDAENKIRRQFETEETRDRTVNNINSTKDPMDICVNTHVLINLESSVQLPSCRDHIHSDSFPKPRHDVNLGSKDDDENSLRCNKSCTNIRLLRPPSLIRYQRIRKMLASRYWKVAPKLKDCELPYTGKGMKPSHRNKKNIHMYERCEHIAPFKKRKLFKHSAAVSYNHEASRESISNSPDKCTPRDKNGSAVNFHGENGVFSSVKGHQAFCQPKDSHVKLSIKSFRVPELYIEIPQSATVGSLKRSVLEAVTSVLGGGLCVGVLLQEKKVRDDNRTLLQTGISHSCNLNALDFTLEPSFSNAPPSEDIPVVLPCDAYQQLSRPPTSSILGSGNSTFDSSPVTNLDHHIESNSELVPPHDNIPEDGTVFDSKALVSVPAMNAEPIAMAPMNQKRKRSEVSQRRTRRPFTVSEVEALVEAVEQLGTGRWRDVKILSFDRADHRTYVDLKDKWKTLVHTATISPQQRRGEQVPQKLLDRVLATDSYWSRHYSNKLPSKHQTESSKIPEPQVESVAAA